MGQAMAKAAIQNIDYKGHPALKSAVERLIRLGNEAQTKANDPEFDPSMEDVMQLIQSRQDCWAAVKREAKQAGFAQGPGRWKINPVTSALEFTPVEKPGVNDMLAQIERMINEGGLPNSPQPTIH